MIITTLFATFIFGPMLYAHREVKKKIPPMTKKANRINRVLADMETDGIRFSPEVKAELERIRNEMQSNAGDLHCSYSDLPSVKSYEKSDNEND